MSAKSALVAGLMLLPMLGASAVGSATSGKVNTKKNYLCESLVVGACLMTLGCALLTTVADAADDVKALGFLAFAGLGFGLSTAAATILVTVEALIRDHAPAQGILTQLRVLGGTLGISTSTVFVHAEESRYLDGVPAAQEKVMVGRAGARLSSEQRDAVHLAYSQAFRKGMIAAAAVSGVAVLLTLGGYHRNRTGVAAKQARMLADEQNMASQSSLAERDGGERA